MLVWVLNNDGGMFVGARRTSGVIAFVFASLGVGLLFPFFSVIKSKYAELAAGAEDASRLTYAQAARWSQLVRRIGQAGVAKPEDAEAGKESQEPMSLLLAHNPKDPLCPCADPDCAGDLLRTAGIARAGDLVFRICIYLVAQGLIINWTGFVTLGDSLWSSPSGVLAAILVIAANLSLFVTTAVSLVPAMPPVHQLALRIHHRAMSLALASLLARYQRALFGPQDGSKLAQMPHETEPYTKIHTFLVANWSRGDPFILTGGKFFSITTAVYIISGFIFALGGSCIPAFVPCFLLVLLAIFTLDLVNYAYANGRINSITDLYRDAQRHVQEMMHRADRAIPAGDAERRQLLFGLQIHDRIL
ncbi:hypothetical protein DFJ74DRAFT_666452 [Hyaloraphidium curvatum]|nr:hypothetical protein DFJ74DRAFT_666452 [Hyaloraphidium curvatum]